MMTRMMMRTSIYVNDFLYPIRLFFFQPVVLLLVVLVVVVVFVVV